MEPWSTAILSLGARSPLKNGLETRSPRSLRGPQQRCSLLAGVNNVLRACGHSESADINMLQLLLYGNKNLPLEANKMILYLTIKYISETERFG